MWCNQVLETSHRHIKVLVPYSATPEHRGIIIFLLLWCSFENDFENCHTSVVLKIAHLLKVVSFFCKWLL